MPDDAYVAYRELANGLLRGIANGEPPYQLDGLISRFAGGELLAAYEEAEMALAVEQAHANELQAELDELRAAQHVRGEHVEAEPKPVKSRGKATK